jgi:hypothetical protein
VKCTFKGQGSLRPLPTTETYILHVPYSTLFLYLLHTLFVAPRDALTLVVAVMYNQIFFNVSARQRVVSSSLCTYMSNRLVNSSRVSLELASTTDTCIRGFAYA